MSDIDAHFLSNRNNFATLSAPPCRPLNHSYPPLPSLPYSHFSRCLCLCLPSSLTLRVRVERCVNNTTKWVAGCGVNDIKKNAYKYVTLCCHMFRGCPFGPVTEPAWPKKKREGFAAATTDAARRFFMHFSFVSRRLAVRGVSFFYLQQQHEQRQWQWQWQRDGGGSSSSNNYASLSGRQPHTHIRMHMCMCMCSAHRPTFARCACKKEKNRHKWQLVRTTFLRRSFFGPFFALAARTTTHSLTGQ